MIFLLSFLFTSHLAHAANQMEDFSYTDCTKSACVMVTAPKAFLGASQVNFTTSGLTVLSLTDQFGKHARTFNGTSATYNPTLQTFVLDTDDNGFVVYSLRDGAISDFRKRGAK